MKKYRVLKYFSDKNNDFYYKPQIRKRFLFWKYWSNLTEHSYLYKSVAVEIVDNHAEGIKIIKDIEEVVYER